MCNLTTRYRKSKTFTGYKYALKDEQGKYYSPATGIEYKIGKVEQPVISKHKGLDYHFVSLTKLLNPENSSHNKKLKGKTALFKNKIDAVYLLKQSLPTFSLIPVILEMTIKTGLTNGTYGIDKIVAGREIINITET